LATQANLIKLIEEECHQILDYIVIYQNVFVQYYTSDIVFYIDSDMTYLIIPKVKNIIVA